MPCIARVAVLPGGRDILGSMKRILPFLMCVACAAVLSACGNKGPLVMPQKPVDVPATPAPAQPDATTPPADAAPQTPPAKGDGSSG